jgi:hypothetical protein
MPTPEEALPALATTIPLFLLTGFGLLKLVGMLLMHEITLWAALAGMAVLLLTLYVGIKAGGSALALGILVALAALMAFYPFALEQLDSAELREVDADALLRAHVAISEQPNNIPAWFRLAEMLYALGLPGHAIALTERILATLSTSLDPMQNRSVRDLYRAEEWRAKRWREELRDPRAFHPIACPKCGVRNPPGEVRCAGCQCHYLVEYVRLMPGRASMATTLLLGWCIILAGVVGGAWALLNLGTAAGWLALLVILLSTGGVLYWLFRPRPLAKVDSLRDLATIRPESESRHGQHERQT